MSWKRTQPRSKQYEGAPVTPRRPVATANSVLRLLDDAPADIPKTAPVPTIGERAYMGRVAALGCLICRRLGHGATPAQVHHIRAGQGGAQRAPHYLTVPLCEPHHTGSAGIHGLGPRGFERRYGLDELGLLAQTIAELCH